MSDVTLLLEEIAQGATTRSEKLIPLVYTQLRELAHARLARERADVGIDATELVHEAYLRLVHGDQEISWESRGHFFSAAAEAMRRILIERARKRVAKRHGGGHDRVDFEESRLIASTDDEKLLQLNEALDRLEELDSEKAELVRLRYFAGFTVSEAAKLLGISKTKAERRWAFIRAWLQKEMESD